MENLIELVDLEKHYRQGANIVRAVDGVSLHIRAGEFVSIVGRSGSGKTTLLDLAGLLLTPTSGAVRIDGADVSRLGQRARTDLRGRRIGFVFQEYNLLPTLNVLENVLVPVRYTGGNVRQGRQRARRLLEAVGLSRRLGHRPSELSGGEQQRVAIARALVNRPALILGDELTGAVDTETAGDLMALLRMMNTEEGVTVVFVTHDLDLAARADRIVRLKDGRVIADETTAPAPHLRAAP